MASQHASSPRNPDTPATTTPQTSLPATGPPRPAPRSRATLWTLLLLWAALYASVALCTPPLLDDADSVHVEVAREMLLRHNYVTLYANGIRYLEKAPLLYWSMAASMKGALLLGAKAPRTLVAAARVPLALSVLGLALLVEALARRLYRSSPAGRRAGLYAALIVLSSSGLFLFTRITLPDGMLCLWTALALYCFWRTEELGDAADPSLRRYCAGFGAACALNVLTKGLIGVVFPVGIVLVYLLLTRGWRRGGARVRRLCPLTTLAVFLALAAPWHLLAGLANPTQGHPAAIFFDGHHWHLPPPTDGNVRGWFWFYFVNEHLLRYLNLRVPHDYDTAPLWLFWGLCVVWLMPWSVFLLQAAAGALPWREPVWRSQWRRHDLPLAARGPVLLMVWAAFILLFFSLSTRQEYYVLPALPALAILIAGWLAAATEPGRYSPASQRAGIGEPGRASTASTALRRGIALLAVAGGLFAAATTAFLLRTPAPTAGTALASVLAQNPGDYALSLGHLLDLTAPALAFFRVPLALAAISLFAGPLAAWRLLRRQRDHRAVLALAAGAFGFLLAAHLGLQRFAPVLSSARLAEAIAPQLQAADLVCIHGEYESGSTLAVYLQRADLHLVDGRSSNLWYGSFFPDAPPVFETPASLAAQWRGPRRVFLWQSLTDPPNQLPDLPGARYILVKSGGKEIVSNRPNR